MIALDTNVLVRLLLVDDPAQSAKARRLVERAEADGEPIFVSQLVLCETVWVMQSTYAMPRREIDRMLSNLLASSTLTIRDADQALRALEAFRAGKGDFADYVIREHASAAGCKTVATFDRALLKEKGFSAP